jgi:hypothetical protein
MHLATLLREWRGLRPFVRAHRHGFRPWLRRRPNWTALSRHMASPPSCVGTRDRGMVVVIRLSTRSKVVALPRSAPWPSKRLGSRRDLASRPLAARPAASDPDRPSSPSHSCDLRSWSRQRARHPILPAHATQVNRPVAVDRHSHSNKIVDRMLLVVYYCGVPEGGSEDGKKTPKPRLSAG